MGDSLPIKVNFESHTVKTVHHINVSIHKKGDESKVTYNEPEVAHIHAEEGEYTYEHTLILSRSIGFEADSDWVLVAKVWGAEAGQEEVVKEVGFHVHPQ